MLVGRLRIQKRVLKTERRRRKEVAAALSGFFNGLGLRYAAAQAPIHSHLRCLRVHAFTPSFGTLGAPVNLTRKKSRPAAAGTKRRADYGLKCLNF
jgi:hypothetical protein